VCAQAATPCRDHPARRGWGELNKWFLPGYDEIYVRFDVMFEDGFQNLRSDGNGMHFFSIAGNRVDDRWSSHPDMTCCYGNLFLQDDPAVPLTRGVWHEIMVHVDAGTPGVIGRVAAAVDRRTSGGRRPGSSLAGYRRPEAQREPRHRRL
jgi:hypothetical protein